MSPLGDYDENWEKVYQTLILVKLLTFHQCSNAQDKVVTNNYVTCPQQRFETGGEG